MSKHSVTIRGLRMVTTCWSWAWSNRTSPSKWVGLGSPFAASSVYGDLTCSVHIYACSIANVISTFVIEDHMLDWHSCQICYPLEIKILLLLCKYIQFVQHGPCTRLSGMNWLRKKKKYTKNGQAWLLHNESLVGPRWAQDLPSATVYNGIAIKRV